MSLLEVNKITPQSGTTLTLGDTGDTINFGSGVLPNFENLTVTGDLTVDTNSLKVDSTNNRVGIGTASPSVALDVVGAITASGTITANSFSGDGSSLTGINTDLVSDTTPQLGGNLDTNNKLIQFGDSSGGTVNRLQFGASQDLQIFHNGSNSFIADTGTGNLVIRATELRLNNSDNSLNYITCTDGGATTLFHNGASKLATTSTGVDITDTSTTAKTLRVGQSSGTSNADATMIISNGGSGDAMLRFDYEGSNTDRARIGVTSSGQILRFYTAGNNERMQINNSGNVGIGTSSPTKRLHVQDTGSSNAKHIVLRVENADTGDSSTGLEFITNRSSTAGSTKIYGAPEDNSGTANLQYLGASHLFRNQGDTGTYMTINSSGNVVIGSDTVDTSGIGGTFTALNIRAGSGYPAIYGQTTATATNKTGINIIGATSGASSGGAAEMLGAMEIACESDSSTNATGFIRFYTGSGGGLSEAMRINSSGDLVINTTTPINSAKITNYFSRVSHIGMTSENYDGNFSTEHIRFKNTGVTRGSIVVDQSSTTYNTSSDYRLKENVVYDWDATIRLKQLKPARFNFIEDETDTVIDGFIAHEVKDVIPNAVYGEKDAVEDDGSIKPQQMDAGKIVPVLTKALQEAMQKIENLESRMETLENA